MPKTPKSSSNNHFHPKHIVGVLGLPVNKQQQFLLSLRNDPHNPAAHLKWQITGGGVEWGESQREALTREFKEELGVGPKILFPYPMVRHVNRQFGSKRIYLHLLCYLVTLDSGPIQPDGEETLDYRWVHPADLATLEYLPLTEDFITEAQHLLIKYSLLSVLQ